jgi:hypothetical protein
MSDVLQLARRQMAEQCRAAKKRARDNRIGGRAKWPLESDSLACHPEQVAERNEFIKGHGLTGVRARRDGTMIFDSHRARQRYLNRIGLIDRSGYT